MNPVKETPLNVKYVLESNDTSEVPDTYNVKAIATIQLPKRKRISKIFFLKAALLYWISISALIGALLLFAFKIYVQFSPKLMAFSDAFLSLMTITTISGSILLTPMHIIFFYIFLNSCTDVFEKE